MRIYKSIFASFLITIIAVVHVHHRVEIMKTGYTLEENKKHLSRLIDRNSKLMYNLSRLESPSNLLSSLDAEMIKFAARRM